MTVTAGPASLDGAAGPIVQPRRARRWGQRWTFGHVVPVVLAVLAFVFVLAGLRDRSATVLVPVASAEIPAGSAVNGSDTRLVSVHRSDTAIVAGLLSAGSLQGGGWVAATSIGAGDPISRSVVARGPAAGSGLGAMSIPVPVDQADGGAIVAGDVVDIIAPTGGGGATYVAEGLHVLSVAPARSSSVLAGSTSSYYIVVAVDRATALRVTAALGTGTSSGSAGGIEVVRSTGETASAPQGTYQPTSQAGSTSAGDAGGGQ